MKNCRAFASALAAAALLAGTAGCDILQSYDLNGTWALTLHVNAVQYNLTVTFSGSKKAGSGSFVYDGNEYSGIYTVENIRIVSFRPSGTKAELCGLMQGSFASSDKMSGTWTNTLDSSITGTWEASRD